MTIKGLTEEKDVVLREKAEVQAAVREKDLKLVEVQQQVPATVTHPTSCMGRKLPVHCLFAFASQMETLKADSSTQKGQMEKLLTQLTEMTERVQKQQNQL